tara:strand:- start:175 stop:312 length:138 start_codon:yes stop_codon:yes gene_type:complete
MLKLGNKIKKGIKYKNSRKPSYIGKGEKNIKKYERSKIIKIKVIL